MVLQDDQKSYAEFQDANLFAAVTENLRQPLTIISRAAELLQDNHDPVLVDGIAETANTASRLLDHYILSLQLQQLNPELVPVSLSASLADVAHQLSTMADRYRCDIELHIAGRFEPVMAHSEGLNAALFDIGSVLLESHGQQPQTKRSVVKLAVHRTRHGIVAGVFTDKDGIDAAMFRRAMQLYGRAMAPANQVVSSAGAGLFIADALLKSMSGGLRSARHQKMPGLAVTFASSSQLALV